MKAFGLGNDICKEFLQKMSIIGDLSEGKPTSLKTLGQVLIVCCSFLIMG